MRMISSSRFIFLPSLKLIKTKNISEMTKEEKDCLAHLIVVTQFKFAKELAKALNGGQESNKMEKIILEKTIEQLKEHLNKE